MDYVIVFLLGVAIAIVPAALWAASQRRPAAAPAAQPQEHGPIIVLPPQPQPVTNNYTYNEIYNDNRRIEVPQSQPEPVPLFGPYRPQPPAQQGGRVFKVVGEREEWGE